MTEEPTTEGLVEDFLEEFRRGDVPDEDSFIAAHPKQAGELRDLLPLLVEMEDYGRERRRKDSRADETPPDLPGSDYTLKRKLGSGGMGTVWEAIQKSLNRKVAVKVLTPPRRRKEAWRERFTREARIVAQLHHPNIVKVYGADTTGNLCYYAMELVDGTRMDKFEFADSRATVRAVLQSALALAYAHRCGVVHRDIKPANLMLDAAGEVRVTDFGLASARTEDQNDEDARNGTLRYMAPERLMQGLCSPAADQYALGVTLWELLSRKRLFADVSGTALFRRICTTPVPPLEGVDHDLAAVVAKSVAPKAEDRYPDMDAFAEDLQRWLNHECVAAAPPSFGRRLRLWARRKPAMAALAVTAAACAVAAVGAMVVGYARTAAALGLAARNAEVADAAIGEVFHHVENMPPSKRDTELLSALLPYYGRLAANQELSLDRIAEVNGVLGICAFRSGDFELAEKAFRRLVEIRPSATALNRLAETLRRRGRTEEAAVFAQRVADGYARTTNVVDRYEAALALESLSHQKGRSVDRKLAFALAKMLRETEPDNPDFRFLYARLLAESPSLERPSDGTDTARSAFALLSDLASDYPDRPEYGKALVTAMDRRLRTGSAFKKIDRADVELALDTADRLLGRFPNVPEIVSSVIAFRDTYSAYLRKLGDQRSASRESLRTTGMLELLSHNAESPDAARHTFNGKNANIPYRQITTGSSSDEDTTLILALHDRSLNGNDNVRQTTVPFLRTLVTYAEKKGRKTVILLPQCPTGRESNWVGARKGRRDGFLKDIARLVQEKTNEFSVVSDRTFVVGVDSGGDACWPLLADNPSLFARALVAGAAPVPASDATNIIAAVRIVQAESDRLHPESSVRAAAERIGGENGPFAEVDLQLGSTHKTVVDNAFSDDALEWLMNPQLPSEETPPFPPSEMYTPAAMVFGTNE